MEVPVGFKCFVQGLLGGSLGFGGEESAGASFVRHDGMVWTTDKDGFIMGLLAVEMMARTGRDPAELYGDLTGSSARRFTSASMRPLRRWRRKRSRGSRPRTSAQPRWPATRFRRC